MKDMRKKVSQSELELKAMNGTMVYLSSVELSFIWLYITGERVYGIAIKMELTVKKTYSLKKSIMNKLVVKNNAEFLFWFSRQRKYYCNDTNEKAPTLRRKCTELS
ncbi:hypothetical protein [Pantoea stewartii]|uniref:hypothetical protein n=1 Tax=Pantoea stewartii TaxID=66269 RepID=UPI0021E91A30|nr:hypothetical protein [Pantoea stewartii]UYK96297.1 hypothetical protein NG832_14060 [Pantoea stewartii]